MRRHSAAAPPVARTVAAAAIGPPSVSTPWQRSPSLHRASVEVRSRTSIRGSAATIAASFEVISCPVWLPPEWTMRRRVWPPSRPSASSPSASRSKTTPRARSSRTAAGASSTSAWTAAGRQSPRPAAIVSAAWLAGESPGSSAAASPPCAQKLALWESGVRETRQTRPPCLGRVQRRPQAGGAAADDGDVELGFGRYRRAASRRIASIWPRSQAAAASRARASLVGDRCSPPRQRASRRR